MVNVQFVRLVEPTQEIAEAFTRWENDPSLIPLTRPNGDAEALQRREVVSIDDLLERLKETRIYLLYLEEQLIGEMSYQVDPAHLFKKEPGTAWLGITIGEAHGRGKGIGRQALEYVEQQIALEGLSRIELGVFEFNQAAHALYQKLGYQEIGRVPDFTYWQGQMWQDIRMDKHLGAANMSDIDLGALAHGPHADLMRAMASKCAADSRIQAIWVGGSLAAGRGDEYSDVDFRIAVAPGQVDSWTHPDWQRYLPILPCGGLLLRFGEQKLLHHLVLLDGTIVDFYVQDTTQQNFEPSLVVLACRDAEFAAALKGFARPAATLVREIDGAVVRQFFVDYWITTHKEMKALARKYDHFSFAGLYLERMALLRAWYMQATGKDIDSRPTLHMLGALHKGLDGTLTEQQHNIMGMPSRTPEETVIVIEAIRAEMARVGHRLADKHAFAYPYELEEVAQRSWNERKEAFTKR